MKSLAILFALVFLATFATDTVVAGGWLWDALNAAGFAAFVGLLYATLPVRGQRNLILHERFAFATLILILIHALGFLLFDEATLSYLRAGAPLYMWSGLLALALVAGTVFVSVAPRRRQVYRHHRSFRRWHYALAANGLAGAAYHMVGSAFYLNTPWQALGLCGLTVAVLLLCRMASRGTKGAGIRALTALTVVASVAFVFARNPLS